MLGVVRYINNKKVGVTKIRLDAERYCRNLFPFY